MSDVKCPFCGRELREIYCYGVVMGYLCPNPDYKKVLKGNAEFWQELIRTRKELEQSETCCTEWEKQALDYKAENIGLSGELERIRKALDKAKKALRELKDVIACPPDISYETGVSMYADGALQEITALEQKDVK